MTTHTANVRPRRAGAAVIAAIAMISGCSNDAGTTPGGASAAQPAKSTSTSAGDASSPHASANDSGKLVMGEGESPHRTGDVPGSRDPLVVPTPPGSTTPGSISSETKPPAGSNWKPPADMKSITFHGLTAPKPATWIEHPPQSQMHTTSITVPGKDGAQAAEIVVFYFGRGQGGPIDANIARWKGQFRTDDGTQLEPKIEKFQSDGMTITLVELEGEYMGMGAAAHARNQMMLSAIIEAPVGNIFIRFVGQKETVAANRAPYVHMLKNLRRIDEISK